ncbi:MAG TPA: septal ring lytic transglycosylase RlpA family protein [Hyphomicrobiaceae bacterium]|nr:septal ring lytic transglycosylase RlpA family protein [Hyphomicrobiaceae bacterium]
MMKRVLTWAAAAVATALVSMPASADWFNETIAAAKAQRGEVSASPSREARTTRTARSTRATAANTYDDGTRPQRRQTSAPRQTVSLSGGGETGIASYYWQPQRVASGGWFNPDAMTAAHKTLPFGTRVRVTHLGNGNTVEVTINDRGPYIAGRIIDLSRRAAQVIGMTGSGIARVRVDIIGRG